MALKKVLEKITTQVTHKGLYVWMVKSVADIEGVQGVRSNPPLEPNYFVFMGNLKRF